MTIKTFWTLFLKILGLWFLFGSIATIVQLLSILIFSSIKGSSQSIGNILLACGIVLVVTGIFILILWLLVFKTTWIIDKLKLTKGFTEDRLEFAMEWSTTLTIATIVIGGVIFIDSFPLFCKQFLSFFQQGKPFKDSQETIWILFYLIKTVLGYLLMTNSKFVVDFIGRQNVLNTNREINDLSSDE